ncbi:MAG: hemerythrin domain-containing protein, partial [Pseudonocardiaceae bacterium]
RDMIAAHDMFRREFGLTPGLIRSTAVGDLARASAVADHLVLMIRILHLHHAEEDRLLWPKLHARAPRDLAGVVTLMQNHHERIHYLTDSTQALLPHWRSYARTEDRDRITAVLDQLNLVLNEHLNAEEQHILPLVRRCLTAAEWRQLGEDSLAALPTRQLPLVFGMVNYEADPEVISSMLAAAPLLPRLLMPILGPRAYARYARRLYGTSKPGGPSMQVST